MREFPSIGLLSLFLLALFTIACNSGRDPASAGPGTAQASNQRSEGSGPALDRGHAFLSVGEHEVVISYGRPALDGRDMLSQLQAGSLWRLGMNEATEIESTSALVAADQIVPAGRYTLFARYLGGESWELLVNRKTGQWGAFEHDPTLDIAKIPLTVQKSTGSIDRLTIGLEPSSDDAGRLTIAWGDLRLTAEFRLE